MVENWAYVRLTAIRLPALLIPVMVLLGLGGLAAFLWTLDNGQYDDLDGAALRILNDDDPDSAEPGEPRG